MSLRTIKRRRIECKTDYKLRMGLLKSSLTRIVIRRTNRYFVVQAVESEEAKDKVIFGITSKELISYGWNEKFAGSLKSIPAGYLTGYLVAKKLGTGEYIVDMGMAVNQKGGRTFAVIAGLIDGKLNVHANKQVFPSTEKLMGEHLKPEVKAIVKAVKEKIDSGISAKTKKIIKEKKK